MNIGVTVNINFTKHGEKVYTISENLISLLSNIGNCNVILLYPHMNINNIIKELNIDRLVLSGGNDIINFNKFSSFSENRNHFEFELIKRFVELDTPILGICRGLHVINTFFGGSVVNSSLFHKVSVNHNVIPINLIEHLSETFEVNSYHNYSISTDSISSIATPLFLDETRKQIEGLKIENLPIVGIQWHPERMIKLNKVDTYLFESFINKKNIFE